MRRPAALALMAGLLAGASPSGAQTVPQKTVADGIAVELTVTPAEGGSGPLREGDAARVRLTFTDAATGNPLAKLGPGAWMDLQSRGAGAPATCKQKVESFVGGSLFARPTLDLNTYYVVTLNEDATLSVVDPLFGYGGSKLLAMVFLDSPGEDWALSADGNRLFVSLPEKNRVAVVDTTQWKVTQGIDTPPGPRRIALQPDGQYLWVAYDGAAGGASGVAVLDPRSLRKVAELPTGRGGHDLAFSDDSRFAFVTNEADGTVSVLDTGKLARLRDVKAGSRPVSIAWSSQAGAAYVVSADGAITALDGEKAEPRARIAAEPGLGRIRFAPGGRLAFIVHPERDAVHILDAASNRIVQTADVEDRPDQVTFSDELAYVRHQGSETVLMIPLKTVGEPGRPVPVIDFPGGQHPPGRLGRSTPADGIVQAPGDPAVLVANSEDGVIYFYKEGMAAPMGHFKNYGKQPRAVLVVDRSLRETRPGVYETVVRLGGPGDYDLALFVGTPRVVQCFPVKVAENPALAAERNHRALDIAVEIEPREPAVGQDVRVRLRLTDPQTGAPKKGLDDVRVLTFLSPGVWQQRQFAKEQSDGRYEITFQPREAGLYYIFVEVASAGLAMRNSPFVTLDVKGPAAAQPPGGTR
jgi:YVTN family beta-propeller protein